MGLFLGQLQKIIPIAGYQYKSLLSGITENLGVARIDRKNFSKTLHVMTGLNQHSRNGFRNVVIQ
jgi:hypothetical protein